MMIVVLLIHLSGGADVIKIPTEACNPIMESQVQQILAHNALFQEGDTLKIWCQKENG